MKSADNHTKQKSPGWGLLLQRACVARQDYNTTSRELLSRAKVHTALTYWLWHARMWAQNDKDTMASHTQMQKTAPPAELTPVHSPCLCLVEKENVSHSTLTRNYYPPISTHQSISFFSHSCLSVSQQASCCALHSLCEFSLLISQRQMDVPLTAILLGLLSSPQGWTQKRTTGISMVQNTRHSLANTHLHRHLNTFHFPIITQCIFTLAPTHSTMHQHLYNITATHTCPFFGGKKMSPKCCSQPSAWPQKIIHMHTRGRWMHKQNRHVHLHTHAHTNTHRRSLGPQP